MFRIMAFNVLMLALIAPLNSGQHDKNVSQIYPYITDVEVGEIIWDETTGTGQYYRIVITTVEIYQHLYIEFITTDSEGFTRKLESHYKVPPKLFNNSIITEEIKILSWESFNIVVVRVDDVNYRIYLSEDLEDLRVEASD